jgi:hypothetical protein
MCWGSVGCLRDVTALWLWVVDPKPFFGRLRRDDERYVENRLNLALVAHNMYFVVTFDETLARLEEGLLTFLVVFSHGTRGNRTQSDAGMMVPAGRASGFEDNLDNCDVCPTLLAFHLDAVALMRERSERCAC